MRVYIAVLCILLAAACFLSGCTSSRSNSRFTVDGNSFVTDDNKSSGEASVDNRYEHTENKELYKALEDNFRDDLIIINNYTMPLGYSNAERIILTRNRYVIKAGLIREYLPQALSAVYEKAQLSFPDRVVEHKESLIYPEWQYLAATLPYADTLQYLFYDILNIKINVNTKVNGVATVEISMSPVPIYDFAAARAKEADEALSSNTFLDIRFTYAYMKAVYDESGNFIENSSYNFTDKYIENLVFPLESAPDFHDTWEQGRSNNTRMHMGTDIRNPEGENMYSCSDGTVIYKGTDKIPGNYVIIIDDLGYEYHYYHMVELSEEVNAGDRVKRGQLIGHVGNTGNSDRSHLHISIIEPGGAFVNPYSLMTTLAKRDT